MLSTKKSQKSETRVGVANTRVELFSAFELIYEAYLRSELIESNPYQMRVTGYQTLRTTDVLIACEDERVVCTVSVIRDGTLGLPMEAVYQNEIEDRRQSGIRMAEVSCLAHDAEKEGNFPVVVHLMSLVAQLSKARSVDQLMIAVHPRHARFYSRFLGFQLIGEERAYEAVQNHPAVTMMLDLSNLATFHPRGYKTLFGTPLPSSTFRRQNLPHSLSDEIQFLAAETTGFVYTGLAAVI